MTKWIWLLLISRAHFARTGEPTMRTGIYTDHIPVKCWTLAKLHHGK